MSNVGPHATYVFLQHNGLIGDVLIGHSVNSVLRTPVKVICPVVLLIVVGEATRESCAFVLFGGGIDWTMTVTVVLLLAAYVPLPAYSVVIVAEF